MSKQYPKYDKYAKYAKKKKKPGMYMRFTKFLKNSKRIMRIANKPSRKEYFLIFKICGIGIIILGVLSYMIKQIALINENNTTCVFSCAPDWQINPQHT